jgi:flagellar M-ring protein FliF
VEGQNPSFPGRIKVIWDRLSSVQRIVVIAGGVLALTLAIYAGIWSQTPTYSVLFSGLDPADAATVVDQLNTQKVSYQLAQGGTTILVPERQVYDMRLAMAKAGLPKSKTVGFELFDSSSLSSMGMTDFMQRVNYQRALEGELARTIGSLEPVASARVHIVIPEPSLFVADQKEPTASIVLQLQPRNDLTQEQVRAITHLVASSVEGLKPTNITLVDMAGNVLAAAGDENGVPSSLQASTGQFEVQRTFQRELESRLQAILDQAVGAGKAIVRVTAAFNWDQKQVNTETYAPSADGVGVVRSQQTQDESFDGTGAVPGGVPGADGNTVPGYPLGQTVSGPSKYTKSDKTLNYEVSKVQQTVTSAPGTLERLSVAVLLDEAVPQDQADRIQSLVQGAAGLDTNRGDALVVERIPFASQAVATPAPSLLDFAGQTKAVTIAKVIILLLAVVVLMRFARMTFRELSSRVSGDYVPYVKFVQEELPMAVTAVPQALPEPQPVVEAIEAAMEQVAAKQVVKPQLNENPWRDSLNEFADRRPEILADLIQGWIGEKP